MDAIVYVIGALLVVFLAWWFLLALLAGLQAVCEAAEPWFPRRAVQAREALRYAEDRVGGLGAHRARALAKRRAGTHYGPAIVALDQSSCAPSPVTVADDQSSSGLEAPLLGRDRAAPPPPS